MYNMRVPGESKIATLIEKALAAGVPQETLVGILTARGWPERDVYEALAGYYERVTGVEIPKRAGAGAAAKEAFFYLLVFSTLATWTIALGALWFALIDRWRADPLFNGPGQAWDLTEVTWALAAILVAFPICLLVSRVVAGEVAANPEKLESGVRKWLTYIALVIAACVFMGDLIQVLSYLLQGELTSQFVAKSVVVLALSGGVFVYYFGGLRRTDEPARRKRRDRIAAGASAAVVAVAAVLGFLQLGPPRVQREMRADNERVMQLFQLSMAVNNYWTSHDSQLPPSLEEVRGGGRFVDPLTRAPFEYHAQAGSQYALCAHFQRKSDPRDTGLGPDPWVHPSGHFCYQLDARVGNLQLPPQYYVQ